MKTGPDAMWTNNADGTRTRIYCKKCLKAGKPWLTPEPCKHILQDPGEAVLPMQITSSLQDLDLEQKGKSH